jgi:hypothetical protein
VIVGDGAGQEHRRSQVMTPIELREFLAKVGEEGLERMNRVLQTETWTIDRWANAIVVATNERKFCDYWHFPTEAEKATMVSATGQRFRKRSFW